MEIPSREDVPHTAIIWFQYEVQEKLPSGENTGRPVKKGKHTFKIEAVDRHICIRKLEELIQELMK